MSKISNINGYNKRNNRYNWKNKNNRDNIYSSKSNGTRSYNKSNNSRSCPDLQRYIKYSAGLACWRKTNIFSETSDRFNYKERGNENKWEVLLIQKRYTYEYMDFVLGKYYNIRDKNMIRNNFGKMTYDEKMLILSMNFDYMWYHIWKCDNKNKCYEVAKNKFQKKYGNKRNKLIKLMANTSCGNLFWEIPKGRIEKGEGRISAAVREFNEETNVPKRFYKILPDFNRKKKIIKSTMEYHMTYYIAITNGNFSISMNYNNSEQVKEVKNLKWFSFDKLMELNPTSPVINEVKIMDTYLNKYY